MEAPRAAAGVISGLSPSPSQWQILQMSWVDGVTEVREKAETGAEAEGGLTALEMLLE